MAQFAVKGDQWCPTTCQECKDVVEAHAMRPTPQYRDGIRSEFAVERTQTASSLNDENASRENDKKVPESTRRAFE
jgi:hypothetical protein